jgi:hypothetical protein
MWKYDFKVLDELNVAMRTMCTKNRRQNHYSEASKVLTVSNLGASASYLLDLAQVPLVPQVSDLIL